VAGLFAVPVLHAEDQDEGRKEKTLREVEVVATSPLPGIGIEEDKLPYDVQSVTAEDIARGQTMNLTDYMARNLSGITINEVQGSPFQADIAYRGFRLSSILGSAQGLSVYLDGVRVNEPFGDVVNWDMIPEAAIGNVTLVPGSNPIYGLNTLGGALAFTTKSGLTAPGTELKVQAGSFGRKRIDVSHGSKDDDGYHRFISATAFDENGWRDYSAGTLGNVFAKIGRQQNDSNWDLSLVVARSALLGNALLPSRNYGPEGEDSPTGSMYERKRDWIYTHSDKTWNDLNMLTFNFQRLLNDSTELSAMAYVRQGKRRAYSGDAEREESSTVPGTYEDEAVVNYNNSRQTSYGGSVNYTRLLTAHQLTLGASADASNIRYGASQAECEGLSDSRSPVDCDERVRTSGVTGKTTALGIYASDTWTMNERTFVTGAARFNHATVANTITNYEDGVGTARPRESFTYNSLNPSVGISYKAAPAVTLFGNIGQSNRVPTVIELGCADPNEPCRLPTGLQADPYLKQVIARTIEFGTRWRLAESEFTASVYRSENKDDILFRAVSVTGLGYFSNFSRTRRQGIDLSARTEIGAVSLHASYNYLDATYQDDGELFGGERNISVRPGTRIAGLPKHTIRVGADWRAQPKLVVGGTVLATSSLVSQGNEDGLIGDGEKVNASVKGYAIMNLHANYEASKGMDYFVRINNVFDTRFETYGMMALNMFDQNGNQYSSPTSAPTVSRFIAPGAPRNFMVGLRYRF
jgi:outer membrane receptor protein involved in Fe transport